MKHTIVLLLSLTFTGAVAAGNEPTLPAGQGSDNDLVRLTQDFVAYREADTDPESPLDALSEKWPRTSSTGRPSASAAT